MWYYHMCVLQSTKGYYTTHWSRIRAYILQCLTHRPIFNKSTSWFPWTERTSIAPKVSRRTRWSPWHFLIWQSSGLHVRSTSNHRLSTEFAGLSFFSFNFELFQKLNKRRGIRQDTSKRIKLILEGSQEETKDFKSFHRNCIPRDRSGLNFDISACRGGSATYELHYDFSSTRV